MQTVAFRPHPVAPDPTTRTVSKSIACGEGLQTTEAHITTTDASPRRDQLVALQQLSESRPLPPTQDSTAAILQRIERMSDHLFSSITLQEPRSSQSAAIQSSEAPKMNPNHQTPKMTFDSNQMCHLGDQAAKSTGATRRQEEHLDSTSVGSSHEEPVQQLAETRLPTPPSTAEDTSSVQDSALEDFELDSSDAAVPWSFDGLERSTLSPNAVEKAPTEQAETLPVSDTGTSQPSSTRSVTDKWGPGTATHIASSKVQQPTDPVVDGFEGLWARDRNPKRLATKQYRQLRTPKKAPKRTLLVKLPTPSATRSEKRAAPTEIGQSEMKRRRRDTFPSPESEAQPTQERAGSRMRTPESDDSNSDSRTTPSQRPIRDERGGQGFVKDVLEVLERQSKAKGALTMGKRQAIRIMELLKIAEYPRDHEAKFLTTDEATEAVGPGRFFPGIIITAGQQVLPLQTVDDFLGEYYEDDTEVWIQDPGAKLSTKNPIARKVRMRQIKKRFADGPTSHPWNCLELATHCDDGLRPLFLNTEDCRLLTKLKIPNSMDEARRRVYASGYREVEKWALLAQGGALTEPHQDSHGYSTFITINQGIVGFGWLSRPTADERAAWRKNPMGFKDGDWRYVVLKPGQTVYFPAGTVHFVFRLPSAGNTLAFGGHVLRCSNIVHWAKTLIEERDQKNVTNEDLTDSATGYLDRVQRFLEQARVKGETEKWGGEKSIEEFLKLKAEFTRVKQK